MTDREDGSMVAMRQPAPIDPDALGPGDYDEPDPSDFGDLDPDETDEPDRPREADEASGEPEVELPGLWLSWPQVIALVAAVMFLAAAATWVFTDTGGGGRAGEVDIGFYQDMTTHHDQAVVLSMLQL